MTEETNVIVPDVTEAIIAVRAFRRKESKAKPDGPIYLRGASKSPRRPFLQSLTDFGHGDTWVPGEVAEANCRYNKHSSPDPVCGCGLYAMADPWKLEQQYSGGILYTHAVVKLWGRVVPGSDGWRAQYAQIVGILRSSWSEPARRIAWRYGVPVLRRLPELTPPMVKGESAPVGSVTTYLMNQYQTMSAPKFSRTWDDVSTGTQSIYGQVEENKE